jgi:hypothetical protein
MQLNATVPAQTLDKMLDNMRGAYQQIPGWITGCTATTAVGFTESIYRTLTNTIANVTSIVQSSTSIAEFTNYADAQYGGGFSITAEWNAWKDQAEVITAWIAANGSGVLTPGQPQPTIDATPLVAELNTLLVLSE